MLKNISSIISAVFIVTSVASYAGSPILTESDGSMVFGDHSKTWLAFISSSSETSQNFYITARCINSDGSNVDQEQMYKGKNYSFKCDSGQKMRLKVECPDCLQDTEYHVGNLYICAADAADIKQCRFTKKCEEQYVPGGRKRGGSTSTVCTENENNNFTQVFYKKVHSDTYNTILQLERSLNDSVYTISNITEKLTEQTGVIDNMNKNLIEKEALLRRTGKFVICICIVQAAAAVTYWYYAYHRIVPKND